MSRQFWTDFLELYMSFPCLWKVSDDNYRNRVCRGAAMKVLLKKLQEVEPLADLKILSRKINTYRTSFRQVYNKYSNISETRASSDDVEEPQPTLWYYKILLPLVSQGYTQLSKSDDSFFEDLYDNGEESRPLSSAFTMKSQSIDDDNTYVELESECMDGIDGGNVEVEISETETKQNTDVSNTPSSPTTKSQKRQSQNISFSKPKRRKNLQDLLEVACDVLARPEQPVLSNRFSAVATNVGAILEELNETEPTQCLIAEKLINDILFQARLGQLTLDTCIVEASNTCSTRRLDVMREMQTKFPGSPKYKH